MKENSQQVREKAAEKFKMSKMLRVDGDSHYTPPNISPIPTKEVGNVMLRGCFSTAGSNFIEGRVDLNEE